MDEPKIEKMVVDSSVLASVGYDATNQILEIEFHSGSVYDYFNIPESTYTALMSASSHGSYFCRNIRGVGYWERVG